MTSRASGSFEVKITPQGTPDAAAGVTLGRMSIDKQLSGDLEATTKGEMLTAMADANGAAAYVAVERVTGALAGKRGTFVLMHNATMTRDGRHLNVTVAPGSGTDQLAGLTGSMDINIVDGKHFYEFEYTLPTQSAG